MWLDNIKSWIQLSVETLLHAPPMIVWMEGGREGGREEESEGVREGGRERREEGRVRVGMEREHPPLPSVSSHPSVLEPPASTSQ